MPSNYRSGWYVMSGIFLMGAPSPLYPNPEEIGTVTGTYGATNVLADSIFQSQPRAAIIRSFSMPRDVLGAGPLVSLQTHDGLHTLYVGAPSATTGIELTDLNWYIEGGFRIVHSGSAYFTLSYEIDVT